MKGQILDGLADMLSDFTLKKRKNEEGKDNYDADKEQEDEEDDEKDEEGEGDEEDEEEPPPVPTLRRQRANTWIRAPTHVANVHFIPQERTRLNHPPVRKHARNGYTGDQLTSYIWL